MRKILGLFVILGLTSFSQTAKFKIPKEEKEKETSFWYSQGRDELFSALNRVNNNNLAKNIILFIGDGMGITVNTAGRIFKGQSKGQSGEEQVLVWEKFPNVALSKTYNLDKQVPDSAATATAYLCGVKGNYYTLGLNGGAKYEDCQSSLKEENRVSSILQWAQNAKKDTGFVTTTRVTHATPAALYAHSPDRYWECDQKLTQEVEVDPETGATPCKDIARQLVEDAPGKHTNVIFAGGRRQMGSTLPGDELGGSCLRNDSRNLVEEWLEDKKKQGKSAKYVTNTQQLRDLEKEDHDYIMGLFAGAHLPYTHQRDSGPEGTPELKEMTKMAIQRLQRAKNGFFLMVEGGRIDHSLHNTQVRPALEELLAFEDAVSTALDMTEEKDTLIIVTADHSHVMTMNGYPERGNDILGTTTNDYVTDNMPYTTLMFTTGSGVNFTWDGEKVQRRNLTEVDTTSHSFVSPAAVPTAFGDETHGGEDVAIYAVGPMSHLFHRVHEQSYIAHVMARAACIGPYKTDCPGFDARQVYFTSEENNSSRQPEVFGLVVVLAVLIVLGAGL